MQRFLVAFIVFGSILLLPKDALFLENVDLYENPVATVSPVVFIGDSVTMGAFASTPENTFAVRVWNDLEARGVKGPADNFWTFDPSNDLAMAQRAALRHRKLIIVELGIHWAPAFDEAGFRRAYGSMLDCLQGSGAIVVVGTIPWLGWAPGTARYETMSLFSQIIRQEAAKRNIAVADLWAATDQRRDALSRPDQSCYPEGCRGDNYHPGDTGHALIAESYVEALDAALVDPSRREYEYRCNFDEYLDALADNTRAPVAGP